MSTKLSIITINYNNASGLRKTMESVFAQTCKDFEYIIVDGASTDGSVDVIREFDSFNVQRSTLNVFTWVSEPDTGIYNAMNKGIRMAKGEYVLMLNSGDYFVDEHVVERILPELDGTDIVQGNTICENDAGYYVSRGYGRSDINYIDVQKGYFLHQASFCKRDLFDRYGYFDESYRISGDTIFYTRCLGAGNATFRYVDLNIAYFESGGVSDSKNKKWQDQRILEFKRRSTEEFSKRQWDTCIEMDKKDRLYNKLHRHKWIWYATMLLSRIADFIDRKA